MCYHMYVSMCVYGIYVLRLISPRMAPPSGPLRRIVNSSSSSGRLSSYIEKDMVFSTSPSAKRSSYI